MSELIASEGRPVWPHAPVHRLTEAGAYMVTAATYRKAGLFAEGPRLRMLHDAVLAIAGRHGLALQAWAVFPNHYHLIAIAPAAGGLSAFIRELHSRTARALNRHDGRPGRKVWHNYWETHLDIESSYYARLHYVHANPVKHGLVAVPSLYPFGSAAWFERSASRAQVRTVYSFKIDTVKVDDDF